MSRSRKPNTTNLYKRCTPVQLLAIGRQWVKKYVTLSKMPAWKFYKGRTVAYQRRVVQGEIQKVAKELRTQVGKDIDARVKFLRKEMASNLGVKITSPKATSAAVKRLIIKARLIKKTRQIKQLIKHCTGVKLASFKNPTLKSKVRKAKRTARKATSRRPTSRRSPVLAAHKRTIARHKRQNKTMKKTLQTLKRRNSFMRKLVNKFRRKIAKLQRTYRASQNRSRLRVVHGKGSSNVVRFNRPNTSYARQRRTG